MPTDSRIRSSRRRATLALGWLAAAVLGSVACSSDETSDNDDDGASSGGVTTTAVSGSGAGTSVTVGSGGAGTTTTSGATTTSSTASSGSGGQGAGAGVDYCQQCTTSVPLGSADAVVNEASGLMASDVHDDVFYVHNDSGDSARFFALSQSGTLLATFGVSGASAVDWEDASLGPCPAGSCVYLGDIGDNPETRTSYALYRVPEPATLADATLTAEAFPFVYPDGSHNAETLLVHPVTGRVWVVTKASGSALIYRFPATLTPGQTHTLEAMGSIFSPDGSLVTGGDVHPAGAGVLLRTYLGVYFYSAASDDLAAALGGSACTMPSAFEMQGETVAWRRDGSGYLTLSEGVGASMNAVSCGP
jgi:hypothetical protein